MAFRSHVEEAERMRLDREVRTHTSGVKGYGVQRLCQIEHQWRRLLAAARVARLDRLSVGLQGDWKSVGASVRELRIDYGPGYRVYYGHDGRTLILLLCGDDKRTQAKDIEKAHGYWKDYKARKPAVPGSGASRKPG